MPKEISPALQKVSRMLNLVPYLSTHQNIALKELANRFDVSKKEILEDLNALWMCGLPGYTPLELIDLSFEDGFVSISNAEALQMPRSLTQPELMTLILGIGLILDAQELDDEQRQRINTLRDSLVALSSAKVSLSSNIDSGHRFVIKQAMDSRKALMISYHSPVRDTLTQRLVYPISLHVENGLEYLQASTGDGVRSFRLDRMSAVQIADAKPLGVADTATRPAFRAKIELVRSDRRSAEAFGLSSVTSEMSKVFEVECFSEEWLIRTVLSCAGAVELKEPLHLRAEIARWGSDLLESYAD